MTQSSSDLQLIMKLEQTYAEPLEKLVSLPMHAALGIKYAEQYLMVYALHVFVYSILLKIS